MPRIRVGLLLLAAFAVPLLLGSPAFGADNLPGQPLIDSRTQIYIMVVQALLPLATYLLNKFGPMVTQVQKGLVLLALSTAVSVIVTQLSTNIPIFTVTTLENVILGIFTAFAAHGFIWKPIEVNAALGGGQNKANQPPDTGPKGLGL